MVLPLAAIGLGLSAAGLGASLYGQREAARKAKRAAKKQALQDAYTQLAQAAGGFAPSPIQVAQPAPEVDYGGALAQAGGMLGQYGAAQEASQAAAQAKADALALEAAKFGVTPGATPAATMAAIAQAKQQQDYRTLLAKAAETGTDLSAGPMREEDIIAQMSRQQAAKEAAAATATQEELKIKKVQAGMGDDPAAVANRAKTAAETKRAEAMGSASLTKADVAMARLALEKSGGTLQSRINQANLNYRAAQAALDPQMQLMWLQIIKELEDEQDALASAGSSAPAFNPPKMKYNFRPLAGFQ